MCLFNFLKRLEQGYVGREEFTVAGSVAGGTDVMTANLFEEGSLFEVSIFVEVEEQLLCKQCYSILPSFSPRYAKSNKSLI